MTKTDSENANSGEALLYSLAQIAKERGDPIAVAVLTNASVRQESERYDNWNGGMYHVFLRLDIDAQLYAKMTAEDRKRVSEFIRTEAEPILDLTENEDLSSVAILPRPRSVPPAWRDQEKAHVATATASPPTHVAVPTPAPPPIVATPSQPPEIQPMPLSIPVAPTPVKVFISHAKVDEAIAAALIEFLEASLEIPEGSIRCTSVPGYKLATGTLTSEALRSELRSVPFVVGLVTPTSAESQWVLFELGARWGLGLRCAPLLHPSLEFKHLPAALNGTHAAKLDDEHAVLQLVDEVERDTGCRKRATPKILVAARKLVGFAVGLRSALGSEEASSVTVAPDRSAIAALSMATPPAGSEVPHGPAQDWNARAAELRTSALPGWWTRLTRLTESIAKHPAVAGTIPPEQLRPGQPGFLWRWDEPPRDEFEHGLRAFQAIRYFESSDLPLREGEYRPSSHPLYQARQGELRKWEDRRAELCDAYVDPVVRWAQSCVQNAASETRAPSMRPAGSRVGRPAPRVNLADVPILLASADQIPCSDLVERLRALGPFPVVFGAVLASQEAVLRDVQPKRTSGGYFYFKTRLIEVVERFAEPHEDAARDPLLGAVREVFARARKKGALYRNTFLDLSEVLSREIQGVLGAGEQTADLVANAIDEDDGDLGGDLAELIRKESVAPLKDRNAIP